MVLVFSMTGWYLAIFVVVTGSAVATAWRVGSCVVVPGNRKWTRAWLILVALAFSGGPSRWIVPVGALYVIGRHGAAWRPRRAVLAEDPLLQEPV